MEKLICEIFKSLKHEGMYLYVEKSEGLERVPPPLMDRFGRHQSAMTMLLTPDKKLARVEAEAVVKGIKEDGYYLQMPPLKETEMAELASKNSKLSL